MREFTSSENLVVSERGVVPGVFGLAAVLALVLSRLPKVRPIKTWPRERSEESNAAHDSYPLLDSAVRSQLV